MYIWVIKTSNSEIDEKVLRAKKLETNVGIIGAIKNAKSKSDSIFNEGTLTVVCRKNQSRELKFMPVHE